MFVIRKCLSKLFDISIELLSDGYSSEDIDCCLPCCKYTSFFGIIFYFFIGLIVLFQPNYLKFSPSDKTSTVIACFLTVGIEIGIFVCLTWYEHKKRLGGISRPEYLQFQEENDRPRASSIKGIAMVSLEGYKSREDKEYLEMHRES